MPLIKESLISQKSKISDDYQKQKVFEEENLGCLYMRYSILCNTYKELEENSSRLAKTEILIKFLQKLKKEKSKEIIYLLQGRVFPNYNTQELGVSSQLVKKALAKSTGSSESEITKLWKELGDLGLVAETLVSKKKQSTLSTSILTAEKVLTNLKKLTEFEGKGTIEKKMGLISELLTSASPLEAKYIIRTILSDLRIGVGESTIRDAIAESCLEKTKENIELVQEALDKTNDSSLVFKKACSGVKALKKTKLEPGKPVKVMLFLKENSIEDAFNRVGKPAAFEYKYDGFRMMINKDNESNIKIFTRRLEEVSKQFPEVVEYVKKQVKANSFILDSEAVGFSPTTKKYMPFQHISQRIKRKYDIKELSEKLPVEVNVFDILYYNGKDLTKEPFKNRLKTLKKIIKQKKLQLVLAEQIITDKVEEASQFYEKAIKEGQEGLMAKNLNAPYKPGARVGYGVKIKPEDRDFDLVITGAEYGTGKRAGWLTSFDVSCQSEGKLLEVGKVSTGLKEKSSEGLSYEEITKKLKPLITKTEGRHVAIKPEVVVTVTYQNIQKSPSYSSGYALRFPRFSRLRPDRRKEDIVTLEEIKKEFKN